MWSFHHFLQDKYRVLPHLNQPILFLPVHYFSSLFHFCLQQLLWNSLIYLHHLLELLSPFEILFCNVHYFPVHWLQQPVRSDLQSRKHQALLYHCRKPSLLCLWIPLQSNTHLLLQIIFYWSYRYARSIHLRYLHFPLYSLLLLLIPFHSVLLRIFQLDPYWFLL